MPDYSGIDGSLNEGAGVATATTLGTTLTGSATANLKGVWAQLVASTVFPVVAVTPILVTLNTVVNLVDIGVGAAAAEKVLIPNLHIASAANTRWGSLMFPRIPVAIPAGTRISARVQGNAVSPTVSIGLILHAGTFLSAVPLGQVLAYGPQTGDSGLIAVDPGAVANTKGAWVEITASTTAPIKWLMLVMSHNAATTATTATYLVDIGIGVAASEVVIIPNILTKMGSLQHVPDPSALAFHVNIPSGTRLAVRCQTLFTTATERLLDIALYGA